MSRHLLSRLRPRWWLDRSRVAAEVWTPDLSDVFCDQPGRPSRLPEPILTTAHFELVADRYPIAPGHLLILPRTHLPCFGATPASWQAELEGLVRLTSSFLRDTYGEPMLWENGIAEQSVHHAHLHFIPMPASVTTLPPPREALRIRGLGAVRRWFGSGRLYHYIAFAGEQRLIPAGARDLTDIVALKQRALDIPLSPDGRSWLRTEDLGATARIRSQFAAWRVAQKQSEGVQLSA